MIYTLKNEILTVKFSDMGAEIQSVKRGDTEYIWQGDPKYWTGRAPVMFPICGRLVEGKYTYMGKTYEMGLHGFAKINTLELEEQTENSITFRLLPTEEIRKMYPFDFAFHVTYILNGETLTQKMRVENRSESEFLPFTCGGHPAFNVPLDGGKFEDYRIEFKEVCSPDQLIFSDNYFNTGLKEAFPMEEGRRITLHHDLFDRDAIFLARTCKDVTLCSEKTARYVRVQFPEMEYMGIWHKPLSDAPYVCIEPWCGFPSFEGRVDDFQTKSDMFRIAPKTEKTVSFTVTFG